MFARVGLVRRSCFLKEDSTRLTGKTQRSVVAVAFVAVL